MKSGKKLRTSSFVILTIGFLMVILTVFFVLNQERYTVNFNSDGGSFVLASQVESGKTLTKPKDPEREGYKFLYWEANGKKFDFNQEITEDVVLKAVWESVEKVIVTFDTNGGDSIEEEEVIKGSKLTSVPTPVKKEYVFLEWKLNDETFNSEMSITENITLKATWRKMTEDELKNQTTVNFNTDGGSTIKSVKVPIGGKVSKPANPTKLGYEFVKWQLDGVDFDFTEPISKEITLKAIWEKVNTYTVKFNTDGGSTIKDITVNENKTVAKPTAPTKTGYIFEDWYLDNAKYDFTKPVTQNIKLVAHWKEAIKYTVTFDSDGGNTIDPQIVYENGKVTKPKDPTKTDYTFDGWYLDNSKYDFNKAVTKDITLVAHWKQNAASYTVEVTKVDNFSPDSKLTVKKNGNAITVSEIMFNDGTHLCNGNNTIVNTGDISGETSFKIKLTDGSVVNAKVTS